MKQLEIPPLAKNDPNAAEVLRAWVVNGGFQCSLTPGVFGDDEVIVWGILLSDVARHVADALYKSEGQDREETLKAIQMHFNAEIDSPTEETKGDFYKN